jgi:hypothetical protein
MKLTRTKIVAGCCQNEFLVGREQSLAPRALVRETLPLVHGGQDSRSCGAFLKGGFHGPNPPRLYEL